MTLVSEIIKDAYREANLIPISQSPTLDEQVEGLRLFNRFVQSLFGNEAGDKLRPYEVTDTTIVSDTDRLYEQDEREVVPLDSFLSVAITEPRSISLNPHPQDGSRLAVVDINGTFSSDPLTLLGNGRKIENADSVVLNTNSLYKEWFYRADLGSWEVVSDLELSSELPFPKQFEDMFVIGLALRLNPRQEVAMNDQSVAAYRRIRNQFRARYYNKREMNPEAGLVYLTNAGTNRIYYTSLS